LTSSPAQAPFAVTNLARRSAISWLNIWQATTSAGLRYWAEAVDRRATPLELAGGGLRWLELVTQRGTPDWTTPNRIVEASPITRLRDFSITGGEGVAPALILPPQAGHHSCIVDYNASQSQVRTALESGLTRTFVVEWLGATDETKDASISDYLASVRTAITRIGEPVHLIGDCQGGWLATIFAALYPEDVATLTIGGAPIDFHAGNSAIADVARALGVGPFKLAVKLGGGMLTGDFLLGGFIGLQPEAEVSKHLELALHLDDDAYVERYREFQDWYATTQPLPGVMYLWAVERLFIGNELVRGSLAIDGRPVRLEAISCPVNLIGGAEDHITPPAQVFALADHVNTPPEEVATVLTSGGHLGLFMGHEALGKAWQPIFARLAGRGSPA
jgi:poly(3-hydroxyalkanoate) synthetase